MPKGKGQGSVATQFKRGRSPTGQPFEEGQTPWNRGKPMSAEAKQKLSVSRKGKPLLKRRRRITLTCERCDKQFEVTPAHKRPYCSQQCARLRGRNRLIRAGGYLYVFRDGKYVAEQRVIAEQMLGRPLRKGEVVHHINGDKLDNRRENLLIMSQACHMALDKYLAGLWIQEHFDEVSKVSREFQRVAGEGYPLCF